MLLAFPPPSGVMQEVTLEADPKDLDGEVLRGLREAGVNRISLGVQSFDDRMLAALGRIHSAGEARRGVSFDRMAVLLHAPVRYSPYLEEALARAGTHTCRPDRSCRSGRRCRTRRSCCCRSAR